MVIVQSCSWIDEPRSGCHISSTILNMHRNSLFFRSFSDRLSVNAVFSTIQKINIFHPTVLPSTHPECTCKHGLYTQWAIGSYHCSENIVHAQQDRICKAGLQFLRDYMFVSQTKGDRRPASPKELSAVQHKRC